jgi:hypothetical protein
MTLKNVWFMAAVIIMVFPPYSDLCIPMSAAASCCCCESSEAIICCCESEIETLSRENSGYNIIYLPPECKFTGYAPIELSDVFNAENIIFTDITYYVFKPPKA